jgi:hypothetical protein
MSGTFGGYPIAGQTDHFLVTYADESDLDALGRANAIVTFCESDLKALEDWFQCDYSRSPYTIWVHVLAGVPGGGAENFGYTDDESAKILISGTYQPASPPPNAISIRDDLACMLFVAELAEVLMDFTGYGWNRSDSAGEGLSRVAAAELHPLGYYTSGAGNGPYVNEWLQSKPRPDFVSSSERTDQDRISYGCAALFINYLVYQLGHAFRAIVPAGGPSLAETFARVTGEPAANAFGQFAALIEAHLPTGQIPTVPRDNIFPLRDGSARTIVLNIGQRELSSVQESAELTVRLKAGPECPAKQYTYHVEDVSSEISAEATAHGFVLPAFTWRVNGQVLPIQIGTTEAAPIPITITDSTPADDAPVQTILPVTYSITDAGQGSQLTLVNQEFPGNGDLTVVVSATERLVGNDPPTSRSSDSVMITRTYDMSRIWLADVWGCNSHPVLEMTSAVAAIANEVIVLLNSPDPPPEQMIAIGAAAERYGGALRSVSRGSPGLRKVAVEVAALARASTGTVTTLDHTAITGGLPVRVRIEPAVSDPAEAQT